MDIITSSARIIKASVFPPANPLMLPYSVPIKMETTMEKIPTLMETRPP